MHDFKKIKNKAPKKISFEMAYNVPYIKSFTFYCHYSPLYVSKPSSFKSPDKVLSSCSLLPSNAKTFLFCPPTTIITT